MRMRWAALTATVLTTFLLTACGGSADRGELAEGSWEDIVAAANDEGAVTFYSTFAVPQNTRLVQAFNERYPNITVNVTRGAGDLQPRVEAEAKAGSDGADVFSLADLAWFQEHPTHLLPLPGPETKTWAPDAWAVADRAPVATNSPNSIFVWNTDMFPNGFTEWEDLLDPSVKGKLGLRTDVTKSVAGYLDMIETELGADYLRALGEQQPKFYSSAVPLAQAVASGEIGVTNSSLPAAIKDLQQSGAHIDFHIPSPGYAIAFGIAALQNAHRPNAAVVFVDFVMSQAGQQALNGDGYGGVAGRDDVTGALDLDGYKLLDSKKFTPEVIAGWKEKLTAYYGN